MSNDNEVKFLDSSWCDDPSVSFSQPKAMRVRVRQRSVKEQKIWKPSKVRQLVLLVYLHKYSMSTPTYDYFSRDI